MHAAGTDGAAGSEEDKRTGKQPGKGERTRRKLLDATARLVAERGLAAASVSSIARAADLQAGSVYFHFASKDELVESMMEEGIRITLGYLDEALTVVGPDAAERLWAAMSAHIRAVQDLPDYTSVVVSAAFRGDAGRAPAFRSLRHDYIATWTALVVAAQADGVLPQAHDARILRDILLGGLNSAILGGRPSEETLAALTGILGLDATAGAGGDSSAG